jgi:N-acetylglucosamine-6-phosphate deacetylase
VRPLLVRAGSALLGGALRPASLLLADGVVGEVDPRDVPTEVEVLDCAVLSPGFVDLHVHALDGAGTIGPPYGPGLSTALARRGVTSFLATTVAAPVAELLPLLAPVAAAGARCAGVHLEGPWLSSSHAGAQPPDALAPPSLADLELLLAAGPPRLLTLAPELPGAEEVVARAVAAGVVVALGHSGATYAQAVEAVRWGARHVTHCFNAMSGLHQREPGLGGAALDLPEVTVELIADGVHVHPAAARLVWRACGAERVCLVSDAVDLALPGADAARLADGTLAGSRMGLDQAVRNLVAWGVPLRDALTMAAVTPGRVLGLPALDVGAPADLVLLSEDLDVVATVVGGSVVWQR